MDKINALFTQSKIKWFFPAFYFIIIFMNKLCIASKRMATYVGKIYTLSNFVDQKIESFSALNMSLLLLKLKRVIHSQIV